LPTKSTALYDRRARTLADRYESIRFEEVHAAILDLLPKPPATVLDVGAGSGRDAAALASRRLRVYAVEPSALMRARALQIHPQTTITWIDDRLPHLRNVKRIGANFDFILLSAVWMHLGHAERPGALRTLAGFLKRGGLLAITLRYGSTDPIRRFFPVSAEELADEARRCSLRVVRITELNGDKFRRRSIEWRTVVLANTSV
jgi:SAM-dependent methyltransferase